MESAYAEMFRDGVLGFICVILIFKGIPAIQDLSAAIKSFSEIINNLKGQFENFNRRLDAFDSRFTMIETKLHHIDDFLRTSRRNGSD